MNLIDVNWGPVDDSAASRTVGADEDFNGKNQYLSTTITQDEVNSRKDSQIGQLIRLLLDKPSGNNV